MSSILDYVKKVLGVIPDAVNAVVPVANGDRTKIVVLVGTLASVACTVYPPACVAVPAVKAICAALAPLFAAVGLAKSAGITSK